MKLVTYDIIHVEIKAPPGLDLETHTLLIKTIRQLPRKIEQAVLNAMIPEQLQPIVTITAKP